MILKDYIRKIGVQKLAADLDLSERAIYSWLYYNSVPSAKAALKIILHSKQEMTWHDIYDDYAMHKLFPEIVSKKNTNPE